MQYETFIRDVLTLTPNIIVYHVGQQLGAHFAQHGIVATTDYDFNLDGYTATGACQSTVSPKAHAIIDTRWDARNQSIYHDVDLGWLDVAWQGQTLQVLRLEFMTSGCGNVQWQWIIAETQELANAFFAAVCAWNTEIRADQELLVFEEGHWQKSQDLRQAIRQASFESLVLAGSLKHDIRTDLEQFYAARATYARYGIPWKRGILFIGPPGNGKTHAIKALVNQLQLTCLYVRNFTGPHSSEHQNIRRVFQRAQEATPCVLVMEDIDTLVNDHNRSFFLNEMDGFKPNEGVVTLATTNYPEQLDPALRNRPSRFDRKYHFDLPASSERQTYIARWNEQLQPELRLSAQGVQQVAEQTEGFSFAYLKELFLASMMAWLPIAQPGAMERVMVEQVQGLRIEMDSGQRLLPAEAIFTDGLAVAEDD